MNALCFSFIFPLNTVLKDSAEIHLTKGIMGKTSYILIGQKELILNNSYLK